MLIRVRDALRHEDGFTLIELMVVVLVMAILLTIGLPTFLGVRSRFEDRASEEGLRNAVLSARILFTDAATFASSNPAQLVQMDPNACYVAAATQAVASGAVCVSGSGGASLSVWGQGPSPNQFSVAGLSASGTCFLILDSLGGTLYGKTATLANCTGQWAGTAGNLAATSPAAAGW
jgi:prepilin-type N-terminal cleavage/methylation domain-containing protein